MPSDYFIRRSCRTCERQLALRELSAGGYCVVCLEDRSEAWDKRWEINRFVLGNGHQCFECKKALPVGSRARLSWDRLAKTFAILCNECTRIKELRHTEHRNTPYAFQRRIQ